jgi:segregation and condensation protein A
MGAATQVGGLGLDLDAFEGPFDLLLTLVLREELGLAEVDLAEIVITFVSHLAGGDRLDLDACGEFLVLISALLELKARGLFEEEGGELSELDPAQAAEELARRLAVYRRVKEAATWLSERLAGSKQHFFRLGPPPLPPPRAAAEPQAQDAAALARALRLLATEPPVPSTAHMALRFPPVAQFLERWRSLLRRRTRLDFDQEVAGFSRIEVAVAFLALLELRKQCEITVSQASPFAPIRIFRAPAERSLSWSGHSA